MSKFRKGTFSIDGINGTFEGMTFGRTWNGWAVPYFTKEVADEIARGIREYGDSAHYDTQQEEYVVLFDGSDEEEFYPAIEVNGTIYFCIGGGSWCWSEDNEELDPSLRSIFDFRQQMMKSLHQLWDEMEDGDYDHKFDLKIEWNGKKIELPMHADLYSRFEQFIDETIEEELQ